VSVVVARKKKISEENILPIDADVRSRKPLPLGHASFISHLFLLHLETSLVSVRTLFWCCILASFCSSQQPMAPKGPYKLCTVNTAPERAKLVVGRFIENVKEIYTINHVENVESMSSQLLSLYNNRDATKG
jgi:hypothetical protein